MGESAAGHTVTFLPAGVSVEDTGRTPLLTLARTAGVRIETACGGRGTCRSCAVRIVAGAVPRATPSDVDLFTPEQLLAGWRRACQTTASGPCTVQVPLRSMGGFVSAGQDGPSGQVALIGAPVLRPGARRSGPVVGMAVDLGTTNVAACSVDLRDGRILASAATVNPQTALGADVISRVEYALGGADRRKTLRSLVVAAITGLARRLTDGHPERIEEIAVCGNTVMQHLLLGLPVDSLAAAPYTPAVLAAVETSTARHGLPGAPEAGLYVAPSIAGFLGGDHVCALLEQSDSAGHDPVPAGAVLLLDIGTNTEIALVSGNGITSVSCASGPAFEGGRISCGMRAAPGAVDAVRFDGDTVTVSTIAGRTPVGICGSGVLSVVAGLRQAGVVNRRGRLQLGQPWVRERLGTREVVLHDPADGPSGDTAGGTASASVAGAAALPVVFTQADVRSVQLAKAAVRTGLDLLLDRAGTTVTDLSAVLLAGAFGRFVDPGEAIAVGLLPPFAQQRVHRVGNAALAGVCRTLVCRAARLRAQSIADRVGYLELAACPEFAGTYARRCYL